MVWPLPQREDAIRATQPSPDQFNSATVGDGSLDRGADRRNRLVGRALPAPEPAPHDFIEVYGVPGASDFETCSDACAEQAAGLLVNGDVIFRVGTISLSAVTARYALPLTPTSVAMK